MMEDTEGRHSERERQQHEVAKMTECYQKYEQETQRDMHEIEQELKKFLHLRAQKIAVLEELDAKSLKEYERLKSADAMVAAEEEACGFCHIQMLPNELAALATGKIIFCKQCGRLLYLRHMVR
ncbi:MAG: hypothetical protein KKE39_04215 [Bacteroidetes bacterium]|nr:hypothetical protein [Bacteroidota bacterium]